MQGTSVRVLLTTAVNTGLPALELRGQPLDPLPLLVMLRVLRAGVSLHLGVVVGTAVARGQGVLQRSPHCGRVGLQIHLVCRIRFVLAEDLHDLRSPGRGGVLREVVVQ